MTELGPIAIEGDAVVRTVRLPGGTARWRYVNGEAFVRVWIELEGEEHAVELADRRSTGAGDPRIREMAESLRTVDPSIEGFFLRREDGAPTTPLAHSYRAPDAAFELPESERRLRSIETRSFFVLRSVALSFPQMGQIMAGDGDLFQRFVASDEDPRFFVRALLPLPIEGADPWLVGTWLEVDATEFARVRAAWTDADFSTLSFDGRLANDLNDIDFAAPLGTRMQAAVREAGAPPFVVATEDPPLAERLAQPWPAEAFRRFAVEHAFL